MIPYSSLYPNEFDSDSNLFLVHDSLRGILINDYNPGDKSIQVDMIPDVANSIPPTGLITLTEQCSDVDERAVSFFYNTWDFDTQTFSDLEILPTFVDVLKPKKITNVTVNVMAMHHNHLKNALIEIQKFCGVKGTEDLEPFGPTLEGRINFLRRLVLQPKAWFTSNIRTGNVPLEVEFKNMSFRLGTDGTADEVRITWDFGDQTTSIISDISLISADSVTPNSNVNVIVSDTDGGVIKKTYYQPGLYDVKLTVENNFGKDVCVFEDFINARVKAPDVAVLRFVEDSSTQTSEAGVPPNGPFETFPKIRSPVNTLINIEIKNGENFLGNPGFSYGGEKLNESGAAIDPIVSWSWQLGDDLTHPNSPVTKASYSVGGIYDCKLRVDTKFGAYRISNYENVIDVVENTNLWLWTIQDNLARAYEYGLISETYKLTSNPTLSVLRNYSFLDQHEENIRHKMKFEFLRNNGFAPRGTTGSGQKGTCLLYWAGGRNLSQPSSVEEIKVTEFEGFTGIYISRNSIMRSWNWANLNSANKSYFIFGTNPNNLPQSSPTNETKVEFDLLNLTSANSIIEPSMYLNGAQELGENVSIYDSLGESVYGDYSVYKTTWKDNTGYIARNDGVGPFFRIKSFYRTEGSIGEPVSFIRKLQDIQGPTKTEGQLTNLSSGVYFLNNSGSVSKFDPNTSAWTSGGPGVNSLLYRNLQDTSVVGFDQDANSLLLASDSDKRAYLSFDYSPNAFIKFSEIDLTFSSLGSRPSGEQWIMGVF